MPEMHIEKFLTYKETPEFEQKFGKLGAHVARVIADFHAEHGKVADVKVDVDADKARLALEATGILGRLGIVLQQGNLLKLEHYSRAKEGGEFFPVTRSQISINGQTTTAHDRTSEIYKILKDAIDEKQVRVSANRIMTTKEAIKHLDEIKRISAAYTGFTQFHDARGQLSIAMKQQLPETNKFESKTKAEEAFVAALKANLAEIIRPSFEKTL